MLITIVRVTEFLLWLVYEDEEKRILGMKYLLATWDIVMDGMENVSIHVCSQY
jgi:hypothetical protein